MEIALDQCRSSRTNVKIDKITCIYILCHPFARSRYGIQQGSFDDFVIDNETGIVTIARKLDFDMRDNYRIELVASDLGK